MKNTEEQIAFHEMMKAMENYSKFISSNDVDISGESSSAINLFIRQNDDIVDKINGLILNSPDLTTKESLNKLHEFRKHFIDYGCRLADQLEANQEQPQ